MNKAQTWSMIPRTLNYKNDLYELIMRIGKKAKSTEADVRGTERKSNRAESIAVKASALSGVI